MRDYWLSKLFFDLHSSPSLGEAYRADRRKVLDRYPLSLDVRAAVERDDVAALAPHVNPYLLRFYFVVAGMSEAEFLARVKAVAPPASGPRRG